MLQLLFQEMSGFTFLHGDEYDPNEPIPFWAPIMKHFTVLTPEEVKRRSPKAKLVLSYLPSKTLKLLMI